MNKPFSQACENNKAPILQVLRNYDIDGLVLEIGSGTGQHAVYFAGQLPQLRWQPSDQLQYLDGIEQWCAEYPGENLLAPLELNVLMQAWPELSSPDHVFSANTAHIMSWEAVQAMFAGIGALLPSKGMFFLYGPFNDENGFTSESNRTFDASLRARDPKMGIRAIADLADLADACAMDLHAREQLPANNQVLVWRKR